MVLKLGIIIGASLLLATAKLDHRIFFCTSFEDLHKTCGCTLSQKSSYDPTCGSDGVTYFNECYLECRKAKLKLDITTEYSGVCENEFNCKCSAAYDPVCGTDGVTYSNECSLMCAEDRDSRVTLDHVGECIVTEDKEVSFIYVTTTPPPDPEEDVQMCFTRSGLRTDCKKTTKRRPVRVPLTKRLPLKSSTTDKDSSGSTDEEVNKKPCVCSAHHEPVCGSNDKTYANFCVLYCVSKVVPDIQLSHWEKCK